MPCLALSFFLSHHISLVGYHHIRSCTSCYVFACHVCYAYVVHVSSGLTDYSIQMTGEYIGFFGSWSYSEFISSPHHKWLAEGSYSENSKSVTCNLEAVVKSRLRTSASTSGLTRNKRLAI